MALSSAGTYLFCDKTNLGTFTKLLDIINYPDMGSTPTRIDTTDLSQTEFMTNILGLQDTPDLTFEANYDATIYAEIRAMTDKYDFQIHFGTGGVDGKFQWNGDIKIFIMGAGVNESRKMQVTISASTPIATAV